MSKQYTPAAPTNGHYLAKILSIQEDANAIFVFYNISVGRSVGWAHSYYLSHSRWPLVQRIDKKAGKTILAQLRRYANAREIRSVVGASIYIEIALERHLNIRCIHSREYYSISSSDIKLGTSSCRMLPLGNFYDFVPSEMLIHNIPFIVKQRTDEFYAV